jgi:hypothetical protein
MKSLLTAVLNAYGIHVALDANQLKAVANIVTRLRISYNEVIFFCQLSNYLAPEAGLCSMDFEDGRLLGWSAIIRKLIE